MQHKPARSKTNAERQRIEARKSINDQQSAYFDSLMERLKRKRPAAVETQDRYDH